MKDQDIDDLLARVQRVDPPPFLLTRIEAHVADAVSVPQPRLVLAACALVVLLLMNVAVLTRSSGASGSATLGDVVEVMGMNNSNQLYE
jgi:hypothetical protein